MLFNTDYTQNDSSAILSANELKIPWVADLYNLSTKKHLYSINTLSIGYKDENALLKAKNICGDRNICYYPDTPFNCKFDGYVLQILCHPQTLEPFPLNRYTTQKLN